MAQTPNQEKARHRNWNKRIITGHHMALRTTLGHGLTAKERQIIKEIIALTKTILSEWQPTLED